MKATNRLFSSFFMGGFECSTQLTTEGYRLDIIAATQHDTLARSDYRLCRSVGICTVREAARWPNIDKAGTLDLGEVRELARIGREEGVVQIWDLMHYGYPDDLDPFGPDFVPRFAAYARAVAQVVKDEAGAGAWYTPVNEISYTAWSGGDVGFIAPFATGRGGEYKRVLVKAAIEAINAIREVDPHACVLTVDPLVHLHAPTGRPDLQPQADYFNDHVVTEAYDMLCGRLQPELGGTREHLGVVGVNYYATNQWTIATDEQPQRFLAKEDPRWVPLSVLLGLIEKRYGGPVVVAETGSSAGDRAPWLSYLISEVEAGIAAGTRIEGVCLYPVITSPDWEDTTAFFDGGLFDIQPQQDNSLARSLYLPMADVLREAQATLDPANLPAIRPVAHAQPAARLPYKVIQPLKQASLKSDNFSYRSVMAGEHLTVEVYGLEPGGVLPPHRHMETEHVLTVMQGSGRFTVEGNKFNLKRGETVFVPAGAYFTIHNALTRRLVVQQVSTPKPWDARFGGPQPPQTA